MVYWVGNSRMYRRKRRINRRFPIIIIIFILTILTFTLLYLSENGHNNRIPSLKNVPADDEGIIGKDVIKLPIKVEPQGDEDLNQYCPLKTSEEMQKRLQNVLHIGVPHKKINGKTLVVPERRYNKTPQLFLQGVVRLPSLPVSFWNTGWNCLTAWDPDEQCVIAAQSFVTYDSIRKKTEYGVVPYNLRRTWNSSDNNNYYSIQWNLEKELLFHIPSLCIRGVPCPVTVEVIPYLNHLFNLTATIDPKGRPEKGIEYHYLLKEIEIFYGRGSFWLMDHGEDKKRTEIVDRVYTLLRKKVSRTGKTITMNRSPYAAHYYFERHIVLNLPPVSPDKIERHVLSLNDNNNNNNNNNNISFNISSHWISTKFSELPQIDSVEAFLQFFSTIQKDEKKKNICAAIVTTFLEFRQPLSVFKSEVVIIPSGCTVLFKSNAGLIVGPDVKLYISGNGKKRSLLTAALPDEHWGGIIVEAGGVLKIEGTTITLTGSSGEKRRKGTGTHVTYAAPAITAVGSDIMIGRIRGAEVFINNSDFLNCAGPVFGAGYRARILIAHSLFQDVAQGGECVECELKIEQVHILDVPYESEFLLRHSSVLAEHGKKKEIENNIYVDGDNDGLYLRGGEVKLNRVVVMNTLDDCIDSASKASKTINNKSKISTHLIIDGNILQNCLHEGIALSSSAGALREVIVKNTIISDVQQGVENGHSDSGHQAILNDVLFRRTQVALRHGDNYPLPVEGRILVTNTLFVNNSINVLNEVFTRSSPKGWSNPFIDPYRFSDQPITLVNCTETNFPTKLWEFPQLYCWSLQGEDGGEKCHSERHNGFNPILCGRRHFKV